MLSEVRRRQGHRKSSPDSGPPTVVNNKSTVPSKYVPYINRVHFARRKKPQSWIALLMEVALVVSTMIICWYTYYHSDRLHLHITRFYARMGVPKAQSLLSQHLLHSAETRAEIEEAVHWLEKAAKHGDPLANYNLVVAHLKDHINQSGLTMPAAIQMLQQASDNGVSEAERFLNHCLDGPGCVELERRLMGD